VSEAKKQAIKGHTPRLVCDKFPKVFESDSYKGGDPVYKIKVIGTKVVLAKFLADVEQVAEQALADARADLEKAFEEAKTGKEKGTIKEALAKLATADRPYKPVYDDDGNETDSVIVQFKKAATYKDKKTGEKKAAGRPTVADRHGTPLKQEIMFGGGSEVIVAYEIRPFYTAAVGAGASLRLDGVQLLKVVKPGQADVKFTEQDGEDIDYDSDTSFPQQQSEPAGGSSDNPRDGVDF